jgi:nicotinamide-nucleotide amidase
VTVRAAIVTVGDELLLGETVDTNAAWLGRALAAAGLSVVRRYTIGDVDAEIQEAVRGAMDVADLVLVSGGLGPTPDDLTRDSVAALLGRALQLDEELLTGLQRRFEARGVGALPATNRSQAEVPEGAQVLANSHGTAPGLLMEEEGTLVALLPGVPRELRGLFRSGIEPALVKHFGERLPPVRMRVVHTTGIPESLLAEQVAEAQPQLPDSVSLAFLPDLRGVDLRLTVRGVEAEEAARRLADAEAPLRMLLAPFRFEADDGDVAGAVVDALRASGRTLATAESCTGGYIGKRLTDRPGSSDVYLGGVVAYANEVKAELLGVDEATLLENGAVSEAVARAMAEGAARSLRADAAVAVTGIAGPGGGTEQKPVGTVWHAATLDGRTVAQLETFQGNRDAVRERATQAALFLLLRLLDGRL